MNPDEFRRPTFTANSVASIDFERLHCERGFSSFVFDLDGTLRRTPFSPLETEAVHNLEQALSNHWIRKACIVSNAWLHWPFAGRVAKAAKELHLPCRACCWDGLSKPNPDLLDLVLIDMKTEKGSTVVVGDQTNTDIEWANRSGVASLWVPMLRPTPMYKALWREWRDRNYIAALDPEPIEMNKPGP